MFQKNNKLPRHSEKFSRAVTSVPTDKKPGIMAKAKSEALLKAEELAEKIRPPPWP